MRWLKARGDFDAVAVVTENGVTPCGACRQVLAEFGPHMTVVVADTAGNRRIYSLQDLLPGAFTPDQLPSKDQALSPFSADWAAK